MPKLPKQTVIPPKKGWEEHTLYLVDISFNEQNPIHRGLFFSGFLNGPGKTPGGYAKVLTPIEGTSHELGSMRYLKVVKKLATEKELRDNTWKLPKDAEAAKPQ